MIEAPPNNLLAPVPTILIPRGPVPRAPVRSRREIELTIDGQKVSVPEGSTILEAARYDHGPGSDNTAFEELGGPPSLGGKRPRATTCNVDVAMSRELSCEEQERKARLRLVRIALT